MDEHTAVKAWRRVVGAAELEPMDQVSNPLWRVIGEDGRRWVLKHLPEFAPGAGPVDEFRVVSYLQSSGLPVAVPVITDDGLIVHNAENLRVDQSEKRPTGAHAYALIPLLPNDCKVDEYADLARTIGAVIGRLDRALAECPFPVVSFIDDPGRQILDERWPHLPEELRALVSQHRDLMYAAVVDLPVHRTHGDCNVGNVLVHHGEVTGFLDLDHLPIGPRVHDLSNYLMSRLSVHIDRGDPETMLAVLGQYVAGFRSSYPLTERETAAVVPLMFTVAIGGADWHVHGWRPDPAAYRRSLRHLEWLAPRYDELVDATAA